MIVVFSLSLLIVGSIYAFLILWYSFGIIRQPISHNSTHRPNTYISIIIAARNEERTIKDCLLSLINQNYPSDLYEIIVIDDHSTDNTHSVIKNTIETSHLITYNSLKDAAGKRAAIHLGIKIAKGQLIALTDADCIASDSWLHSISSLYEKDKPKMILGPVAYKNETTLFEKMQSLEFLSYTGVTAGSCLLGHPVLANGANLVYEKKLFFEFEHAFINSSSVSGDDVLLLHLFKKKWNSEICYNFSKSALVYTSACSNVHDFIEQRNRWVSKSSKYNDVFTLFNSGLVFLFNFLLSITVLLSFFIPGLIEIVLIIFASKCIIDLFFLYLVVNFVGRISLVWLTIPLQLIYIFYIPLITILSLTKSYNWKGRIHKK